MTVTECVYVCMHACVYERKKKRKKESIYIFACVCVYTCVKVFVQERHELYGYCRLGLPFSSGDCWCWFRPVIRRLTLIASEFLYTITFGFTFTRATVECDVLKVLYWFWVLFILFIFGKEVVGKYCCFLFSILGLFMFIKGIIIFIGIR